MFKLPDAWGQGSVLPKKSQVSTKVSLPKRLQNCAPWVPPEHAVAIWVPDGTGQYSPKEKAEHLIDEHPQHGPFWWCSWCEQHNSKLLIVVYPFLFSENSEKDNATTKSGTSRQVQKIIPSQQVRLLHQSLLAGWTISQGPCTGGIGGSPIGKGNQGRQRH